MLISILSIRKIPGAIIIGILSVTLISIFLNLVEFEGVFSIPPDVTPVLMKLDILGALDVAMISVIVSFLFVNLFDTAGTLFGVATRANLVTETGNIKDLDKALKDNIIFGAGLDVFEKEPIDKNNPLINNEKVLLSPHSATFTNECKSRMAIETTKNIIDFFENKLDKSMIVKI